MHPYKTLAAKVARVMRRSPRDVKPAKTTPSTRRRTNPITPPAAIELAPPSAASRRELLPYNYVPPCPRNALNIFGTHFFLESKTSHPARPTESIMKKACKLWMEFSQEERRPYELLAKAEMDLQKTRFPEGRESYKRPRFPFALHWSVATDHLFVIDAQGAIQYAPMPVDDAPMFVPYEVDGQSYMGVMDYTYFPYPLFALVTADLGFSAESSNCVGGLRAQLSIVDDGLMDCAPPVDDDLMDRDPVASSGSDYDLSPLIVPRLLSYTEPDEDREAIDHGDATIQVPPFHTTSVLFSD
ncbi:hypothetical protein BDZ89DRAFT_1119811 [Hymenopellis radicata]|nr:hypothetical protein BDZ89DRAFT_1119811 [Hymenopellis radicata]